MNSTPEKCHLIGLWIMRGIEARIFSCMFVTAPWRYRREGARASDFFPSPVREAAEKLRSFRGAGGNALGIGWSEDDTVYVLPEYHTDTNLLKIVSEAQQLLNTLRAQITDYLRGLDIKNVYFDYHVPVHANTRAMADALGLDEIEHNLLLFLALGSDFDLFSTVVQKSTTPSTRILYSSLSILFDCKVDDIRRGLSTESILVRSGLIQVRNTTNDTLISLTEEVEHQLFSKTPDQIFDAFFVLAPKTPLTPQNFDYYADKIEVFKTYLQKALKEHQPGVNVLFYGKPGIGKSELAKVLAQELQITLYQVVEENTDRSAKNRDARLTAFRMGQEILQHNTSSMMLFDEVEDIFASADSEAGNQQKAKGFVNRLLETNAVPTFWITNSCHDMDAAVLRRFDLILKMAVPAKSTREKIAKSYFSDITDQVPEYLLNGSITSADMARIAKVTKAIHAQKPEQADKCIGLLAEEYLKLYGQQHEILPVRNGVEVPFDPELCNCKTDFTKLLGALKKHPAAAVLLVGPEGSGKRTAAHYIGEHLGVVIEKSAAELIGQTPSHTAYNLREFFEHLRRETAVGLLKNADVLFEQTSEPSATNTLLVDNLADLLSRHTGVSFISCTGPVSMLPTTILDCFEVKLEFGRLTAAQVQRFVASVCNVPVESVEKNSGLNLLPQNIITMLHRAQLFDHVVTPEYLMEELKRDVASTQGRTVGFC